MELQIGDSAPDFSLPDQQGNLVALSSFRGKAVLLVFYPLSFTNVCTGELCALRDDLTRFHNQDVQLLALSVDSVAVHRIWAEQQSYEFPILADFWPHGEVAQAYGSFDQERGVARRGTFLVDQSGRIRWKVVMDRPGPRDQRAYEEALADVLADSRR